MFTFFYSTPTGCLRYRCTLVTLLNSGVLLLVAKLHPVAWKRNAYSEELLPGPEAVQSDWLDGSCVHSVYHCNMALHGLQRPYSVSIKKKLPLITESITSYVSRNEIISPINFFIQLYLPFVKSFCLN